MIEGTREYLQSCYHPTEIRMLVLQNDIFGKNTLSYFEQFDMYKLLETSVIDCIMVDLWNSDVDSNGWLLENSTSFQIMKCYKKGFIQDYERKHRFYDER